MRTETSFSIVNILGSALLLGFFFGVFTSPIFSYKSGDWQIASAPTSFFHPGGSSATEPACREIYQPLQFGFPAKAVFCKLHVTGCGRSVLINIWGILIDWAIFIAIVIVFVFLKDLWR